jgi:formate C-acetyltransferase
MTPRIKKMYDSLIDRSLRDRSKEWFTQDMLKDVSGGTQYYEVPESVLIRRSRAIDAMLQAMTNPENSKSTLTAYIEPGDLLLGTLPMGSNGLGKVFPNYLTESEKRAGSITNRSSMSLLGHNSLNYTNLVTNGLQAIIEECDNKSNHIHELNDSHQMVDSLLQRENLEHHQVDFYDSVKIACQAVVNYASRMADIAEEESKEALTEERKAELLEMARIARKVPMRPAETFHEALQSIWFYHLALHSSMNLVSLGRLDQVLDPFLEKEKDKDRCLELFECFLIKAAWRLNLNLSPANIVKQDHVDNSTVLGTNPYLIDQKAGVNNFLQNIIVGGKKPDGTDATNECTYLILEAFREVNLSTPGIYVRIHKDSKKRLIETVAKCWETTRNNPSILNDEIMIPAMKEALLLGKGKDDIDEQLAQELANDYCVDGCWEPILNSKSDWTFSMLSALDPLECAFNEGAMLTNDPELLRGAKKAPRTPKPDSFESLMDAYKSQLGFFIDQGIISLFLYYMIDEYACPSPLLSAYLEGCMDRGRDKAWGGTDYNIGGIILSGVPNVVNTLAAMRLWVFPEKGEGKYTLDEVCNALRNNYQCGNPSDIVTQSLFDRIKVDFSTNTPFFGTNNSLADEITNEVLDIYFACVKNAAAFAKRVYQYKPRSEEERRHLVGLRSISGYYGLSLEEKFGKFNMVVTSGLGTFEQYNWMGRGNAASADRLNGEPLAPNYSPVSGTATAGIGGIFASLDKMHLERFAAGVITDTCLEQSEASKDLLEGLLKNFVDYKGGMMTLAIGDKELYQTIYEQTLAAQKMSSEEETLKLLKKYANVNVRIGGWQTPFITLPTSHMENYILRPVTLEKGEPKTAGV